MHDLAAITPLGGTEPRRDTFGNVTISEVTDRALASVTCRVGKAKTFTAAATKLFGMKLPDPRHWTQGKVWGLIWTGPEQWFADAPLDSHDDIARLVKDTLGDTASVTEQTGGWARFDVEGSGAVEVFERLAAAPSRRMQAGDATRTLIEHLGCYLVCRAAGSHFSVLGPRSSAASLHHALTAAGRSIA